MAGFEAAGEGLCCRRAESSGLCGVRACGFSGDTQQVPQPSNNQGESSRPDNQRHRVVAEQRRQRGEFAAVQVSMGLGRQPELGARERSRDREGVSLCGRLRHALIDAFETEIRCCGTCGRVVTRSAASAVHVVTVSLTGERGGVRGQRAAIAR